MIFIIGRFTPAAFGLATAVKQFATATNAPRLLAHHTDHSLLVNSGLRPISLLAAAFSRDRVWHNNDLFAPFALALSVLGLLTYRRLVICPHGMLDRWALRSGRTRFKLAALAVLDLLARVGHLQIHALNAAEARKAAFLLPHARAISVVSNGIPADILAARQHIGRRPTPTGPLVIGLMSRISPKKNQLAMVELASELQRLHGEASINVQFRIDGVTEDAAYAGSIVAEIVRRSLGDRIKVGGAIAFEARADCLAGYDIMFFPSVSEGMPYVVLEAMALGVPVLASHRSSCSFVQDYGGRVYKTIADAAKSIPLKREGLKEWQLATDDFVAAFDTRRLKAFFEQLTK